ncbi:cupin domain-containing protein [Acidobacteriota bacterium]
MIIKKTEDIPEVLLDEQKIKGVYRKILLGPDDGSLKIVMRLYNVTPGGYTPFHSHEHEHIVRVENGKGVVVTNDGEEIVVSKGQNLLVESNEKHQFKNPFHEPFKFSCTINNPEK